MSDDSPIVFDTPFLNRLAVAGREDISLGGEEQQLAEDMRNMTYPELAGRYGRDVADQASLTNYQAIEAQRAEDADTSFLRGSGDAALAAASGFVGLSGNTFGQLFSVPIGAARGAFDGDPDTSVWDGVRQQSVDVAGTTQDVTNWIDSFTGDVTQANREWQAIESDLLGLENQRESDARIEAGANETVEMFRRVGANVLDEGQSILDNPTAIRDITAGAVGSLGPSAAIARNATEIAVRNLTRLPLTARQRAFAQAAATSATIGATEASESYSGAINQVMDLPEETLQEASVYQALLAEGYSPEEARVAVAVLSGQEAFAAQLPAAIALGALVRRFETAPIESFASGGVLNGLRSGILQTFEEGGQEGSSTAAQNLAIQRNADPSRTLDEGVGQAIAQGAIGGLGMSGVMAVPGAAVGTGRTIRDVLTSEPVANAGRAAVDAARTGASAASETVVNTVQTIATNPRLNEVWNTALTPVRNIAEDRMNPQARQQRTELGTAAQDLRAFAQSQRDTSDLVSSEDVILRDNAASVIEDSVAAAELIVGRNVTDSMAPLIVSAMNDLRSVRASLPEAQQAQVDQILNSKPVRAAEQQAARLDLNTTQDETTEITPEVIETTLGVAATNPTNVNPNVVNKILEQSRDSFTPEQVKLLEGASRIAAAVNTHSEQQVQIIADRDIGLEKIGQKAKPAKNVDTSSRSIRVEGYTNASGRKQRSINDFAADIIKAMQGDRQVLDSSSGADIRVPVSQTMREFGQLVQHLNNKVSALNTSLSQNGSMVKFDTLVNGRFMPAERTKNGVRYNQQPGSIMFAKQVENDLQVATQVYNELRSMFPDEFGSVPEAQAVVLQSPAAAPKASDQDVGTADEINAEIDAQEAAEAAQAERQDGGRRLRKDAVLKTEESLIEEDPQPTAVEEVSPGETDEQNQQEETSEELIDDSPTVEEGEDSRVEEIDEEAVADEEIDETSEGSTDEQIEDVTETEAVVDESYPVHESFNESYSARGNNLGVKNLEDVLTVATEQNLNPELVAFMKKVVRPMVRTMNKRIQEKISEGVLSLKDLQKGEFQNFMRWRNTAIVDPETGQYIQDLAELAAVAMTDWMSEVTGRDANQLEDTLQDMGLTIADIQTQEDMDAVLYGVPPAIAKAEIAQRILQLWDVRRNDDTRMSQVEGIAEGLAAEMITTVARNQKVGFLQIAPIALGDGRTTETIIVKGLKTTQQIIREARDADAPQSVREMLIGERTPQFSVGKKLTSVAQTQSRSDVQLSDVERTALRKMQDTPHYADQGRIALVEAIGGDVLADILGWDSGVDDIANNTLRASVHGRNESIRGNIEGLNTVLAALGDNESNQPVYYPVSITKVGRHQYQGINPQSNKLLRALVTPTWSSININDGADMAAFWLGIAQASDLYKVEKGNQEQILAEVEQKFTEKYGDAVNQVVEWLRTGELDAPAFAQAMGVVEPQQIAAVHAVAELRFNMEVGNTEFQTSLSFELDGLTNGAANMMINYGQGEITGSDFNNFNRVGFFLGRVGKTVNDFFTANVNGVKNKDLYERAAEGAQSMLNHMSWKAKDKATANRIQSAKRFAAYFGDLQHDQETGEYLMTRNSAKNPMTKVNYGSGVQGVGAGIADDMMIKFYEEIQGIPANTNLAEYFGYPNIENDIFMLFGINAPKDLKEGAYEFSSDAVQNFRRNITNTLGQALYDATKGLIGDKITDLNDMLVLSTNIQNQYLQLSFQQKLEALAEKRAKDGKIRRDKKTGKPILADMTRRDYMSVVNELSTLAPIFTSDEQTLAIGGFENRPSELTFSSNMDEKLKQKAQLPFPEDVGVRAIPYSVIGTGDAMMMNLIFSNENVPNDMLGIFDGIDMPVGKVKEYAPMINEMVLKSWERDVLAMGVQNYTGFLKKIGNDPLLDEAFSLVMAANKKENIKIKSKEELAQRLEERLRANRARKAVFKRVTVSVDQMGGSDVGYTRGEEEVTLAEINRQIEEELNGTAQSRTEDVKTEVLESTVDAMLGALNLNDTQKKVAKILQPLLTDVRVIVGSQNQLNDWRAENLPDSGDFIRDVNGAYDAENGIIFLTSTNPETVLHEMVHAGTFNRVLDHYTGQTNDAVTRLESLMEQFMEMDTDSQAVVDAKAAILRRQADVTPEGRAAALNEFMAYALTDFTVSQTLQNTEAKGLKKLAEQVLQLMRRLMGGIPKSMFDQVVFNTKVLIDPPIEDGGDGGNGDGNDGGESTPPMREHLNHWRRLAQEYIDEHQRRRGNNELVKTPVRTLTNNANKVVNSLRQVGMLSNDNMRRTFKAIYLLMGTEMQMDSASVIALTRIFQHIETEMSPEMFGTGPEANQEYSAVINAFGQYKTGNVSDAIAVLLALSQTSNKFRKVLSQIPDPQGEVQIKGALNAYLTKVSAGLMQKVTGSIDINDQNTAQMMDDLAAGLLEVDRSEEYALLRGVTRNLDRADNYVSGKFRELAQYSDRKNKELQENTRSQIVRGLGNTVRNITALGDKTQTEMMAEGAKRLIHMGVRIPIPFKEIITEFVGTDRLSKGLVAMYDQVNYRVAGMRQAYREDLPGILSNTFQSAPNPEQWKSMFNTLAKTDITQFLQPNRMQQGMGLLEESGKRKARIQELETAIGQYTVPYVAQMALDHAEQLARYMMGQGAGKLLMRNAYAIAKNLDGNFEPNLVPLIDELVSLYALDVMDPNVLEETVQLWQNDPQAITGLVVYIQGLNEAEDSKAGITEQARLNAYKGYIPNHGNGDTQIIVAPTESVDELRRQGYQQLAPFTGEVNSITPQSYYVTNTRQGGMYSQGIMQNVAATYRGVDINTGLSVTGETSGFIGGEGAVISIVDEMNKPDFVYDNSKEVLMPVFDEDGTVLGFERSISPDILEDHSGREENLALMLGAWAGRHVEEGLAREYNETLLTELDRIYHERKDDPSLTWVNLKTTKDPIMKESFKLWTQAAKDYADGLFDGEGPMVLSDQVNLTVGYREASVVDMWSGKTRLPEAVQKTVQNVSDFMFKGQGKRVLGTSEVILQGAVSEAKDIIVIRSLLIPLLNTRSNVIQLTTNGVPNKKIMNGYRSKLGEIEEYNKNEKKRIELEALLRTTPRNSNRRKVIENKLQVIQDLNNRMSIAPMIEAGAYKMLSEGITDVDVAITSGRFGSYIEKMSEKLPDRVSDIAKVGLVSKSTQLYKFANRATQYGDFLAKSIWYDHLISQGVTAEEALALMNEEFVNFSHLPGRTRSYLESSGMTWFMAFKIRIAKIALRQIRDHPVRALAINDLLPGIGSPIQDNVFSVVAGGRLDYAIGYEMLFDAPGLNPWVNLVDG